MGLLGVLPLDYADTNSKELSRQMCVFVLGETNQIDFPIKMQKTKVSVEIGS